MKNDESFDRLVRRGCVAGSLYRDGAEVNRKDEEGVSAKKLELSPHFFHFRSCFDFSPSGRSRYCRTLRLTLLALGA